METSILSIETPESFRQAVIAAARLLRRGEVVAVPTETVYGLAANALAPGAVEKIYNVKGRPAHNPVIVHVASLAMARQCVSDWPPSAEILASAFWPGPLTLVLPKSPLIPPVVTAGGPTVGIRWPGHPFIQELIRECGFPIAAPSANLANQISPTTAGHVSCTLTGKIPLIIDAGAAAVGIESTVVDISGGVPRVLRPGMISSSQIQQALGASPPPFHDLPREKAAAEPLRSPGLLLKHYAPRAKLVIASWQDDAELLRFTGTLGEPQPTIHILSHDHIPHPHLFGRVSVIPEDPEAYARALYAELHASDNAGARIIVVEALPETPEWEGIRDRLTRASA